MMRGRTTAVSVISDIDRVLSNAFCGRGQIITQDPVSGVLCGGSDGRGDGSVYAY